MTIRNYDIDTSEFTGSSSVLREFTAEGLEKYKELVSEVDSGSFSEIAGEWLFDDEYSSELGGEKLLRQGDYISQFELISHIYPVVKEIYGTKAGDRQALSNAAMFNWLSAFFFRTIHDPNKSVESLNFFFDPDSKLRFNKNTYRHRIFGWYFYYSRHLEKSFLVLSRKPNMYGDMCEQILAGADFRSSAGFLDGFNRLYSASSDGEYYPGIQPIRGKTSARGVYDRAFPGSLRRYKPAFQRLARTYDIHHMTADELLPLLGEEFVVGIE
jgi:hypothetical protein